MKVDLTNILEGFSILSGEMDKKFKMPYLENKEKYILAIFISAMSKALQFSPIINAVIDGEAKNIINRDYQDFIVPLVDKNSNSVNVVIKNVQNKNFNVILKEIDELQKKIDSGKLSLEDVTGGTIGINPSNVSLLNISAIEEGTTVKLGINQIVKRPFCVNNDPKNISKRDIMLISLTYDHRLIDGREGVLYLKKVKELLENPLRFIINI